MLLPLTAPAHHLPLMFVVSVWLVLVRMLPPRRPSWTFRILPGQPVAATVSNRTGRAAMVIVPRQRNGARG
jgi:hypothetical protein